MESWSSIKGRGWLGKTVSPRPTELKAWAYKDFKIEDLFSAQTGDTDLQQKDINGRGTLFVNSGVEGLGIKGKTDREAKVFDSNTITIDFWGNAYYRDFEYKMATHNYIKLQNQGNIISNLRLLAEMVNAKADYADKNGYYTKRAIAQIAASALLVTSGSAVGQELESLWNNTEIEEGRNSLLQKKTGRNQELKV